MMILFALQQRLIHIAVEIIKYRNSKELFQSTLSVDPIVLIEFYIIFAMLILLVNHRFSRGEKKQH